MRARGILAVAVAAATCAAGCSLLFDGNDLHGGNGGGGGDMAAGGSGGDGGGGGAGDDMAGGGSGGGGGGPDLAGGTLATVAFTPGAMPYPVGAAPYDITVGDFDGDGKIDAATANDNGNNVSLLFGGGNGSFTTTMNVVVPPTANGCSPYAITAGKFDANSSDDIIVTCTNLNLANHVYILKGASNRTLSPVEIAALASTATSTRPESVAVGDFNHDGKLDVVTANAGTTEVAIVAGNGDGTFGAASERMSAGTVAKNYVNTVAVGDFNGDGFDDIAAGDYLTAQVFVFSQTSAGVFGSVGIYNTVGKVGGLAAGNLDGNSYVDLVSGDSENDGVAVLVADKSGFPAAAPGNPPEYAGHPTPASVAIADFNRDGKPDLVVANANSPGGSIDVYLGNGDGTFGNAIVIVASAKTPISVRTADLNGDGLSDFVVANNDTSNPAVSVYLNSSH